MNLERMNMHTKFYKIVLTLFAAVTLVACVDNDDDIPMNYYSASKVTAAGFLEKNQDQFSEFISILKRTPYFSMLSTYGDYTLFAPDNSAIERYLKRMGYNSIDAITDESCDTLARTHIIISTMTDKSMSLILFIWDLPYLSLLVVSDSS